MDILLRIPPHRRRHVVAALLFAVEALFFVAAAGEAVAGAGAVVGPFFYVFEGDEAHEEADVF